MNDEFIEKSYMTKSTKNNPVKRKITQRVPVFDWDKFKLLPNAADFVEKFYDQYTTQMMREIDEDKNGTRPEHLSSMENVIARSIGYSEQAIREWCESRDWDGADIAPEIAANITKFLVKFATRKSGALAGCNWPSDTKQTLAKRVLTVVGKNDSLANWLFTRVTTTSSDYDSI